MFKIILFMLNINFESLRTRLATLFRFYQENNVTNNGARFFHHIVLSKPVQMKSICHFK